MNAVLTDTARACLLAAHDGSMAFPAIVARLVDAGVDSYAVDYRRGVTTYYGADGDSVVLDNPHRTERVSAAFRAAEVAAAVRWAQSGADDYSYPAFSDRVTAAGCAAYLVSFPGRRVVYFGRTGETLVEHFPR